MKKRMPDTKVGRIAVASLLAAGLVLAGSGLSLADGNGRQERRDSRYEERHDGRSDRHDNRSGNRRGNVTGRHRDVTVIRELPRGYRTVVVRKTPYYVHNDRFYRRGPEGFIAVRAPFGAVVASLPIGSVRVSIGGTFFFRSADVYYRPAPTGYMVVSPPPAAPAGILVVRTPVLNVRSGPGPNYPVIGQTLRGDVLYVSGNAPGWHYVQLPDGLFGWVMSIYTAPAAAG